MMQPAEEVYTQYFLADIDTLIPYARNARTHSDAQIAQIAASIKEFGFISPMTETQRRAYILADNKLSLNAGWDDELLAVEMEELQNLGFDLGLTGFDEKELADLFADDAEAKQDDFDIDAELEKPCFRNGEKLPCTDVYTPTEEDMAFQEDRVNS